ncbi:MAG: hypothetical protein HQL22_06420 [Candidatus Omnitrophica bacterium]|nr:hypothetical protein [Candidatus Omnitrophota bacterium]
MKKILLMLLLGTFLGSSAAYAGIVGYVQISPNPAAAGSMISVAASMDPVILKGVTTMKFSVNGAAISANLNCSNGYCLASNISVPSTTSAGDYSFTLSAASTMGTKSMVFYSGIDVMPASFRVTSAATVGIQSVVVTPTTAKPGDSVTVTAVFNGTMNIANVGINIIPTNGQFIGSQARSLGNKTFRTTMVIPPSFMPGAAAISVTVMGLGSSTTKVFVSGKDFSAPLTILSSLLNIGMSAKTEKMFYKTNESVNVLVDINNDKSDIQPLTPGINWSEAQLLNQNGVNWSDPALLAGSAAGWNSAVVPSTVTYELDKINSGFSAMTFIGSGTLPILPFVNAGSLTIEIPAGAAALISQGDVFANMTVLGTTTSLSHAVGTYALQVRFSGVKKETGERVNGAAFTRFTVQSGTATMEK